MPPPPQHESAEHPPHTQEGPFGSNLHFDLFVIERELGRLKAKGEKAFRPEDEERITSVLARSLVDVRDFIVTTNRTEPEPNMGLYK